MSNGIGVTELASELSIRVLTTLDAHEWQRLGEPAERHTSGRLSREGWECATLATIERHFQRESAPAAMMIGARGKVST